MASSKEKVILDARSCPCVPPGLFPACGGGGWASLPVPGVDAGKCRAHGDAVPASGPPRAPPATTTSSGPAWPPGAWRPSVTRGRPMPRPCCWPGPSGCSTFRAPRPRPTANPSCCASAPAACRSGACSLPEGLDASGVMVEVAPDLLALCDLSVRFAQGDVARMELHLEGLDGTRAPEARRGWHGPPQHPGPVGPESPGRGLPGGGNRPLGAGTAGAYPGGLGGAMPFRDECGVFGIAPQAEAARQTYLGLYALQHRGQEAAGICSRRRGGAPPPQGPGLRGGRVHGDRPGRACPGTPPSATPATPPPAATWPPRPTPS